MSSHSGLVTQFVFPPQLTVEQPAELLRNMADRDPAIFNIKTVFFRHERSFGIGCPAKVSFDDATVFEARLISTSMAPGEIVTPSGSMYC